MTSQPAYISVAKQYQTIAVQILRSICSHESVFQNVFPKSVTLSWMMPPNSCEKKTQGPATQVVQITGLVLTPPFGGYAKGQSAELDVAWRMPFDDAWVVAMSSNTNGYSSDRDCGTLTIEIDFTISHSEVALALMMMNVRSLVPKRLTLAANQNLASPSGGAAAQELQQQSQAIAVPVFWSTHQVSSSNNTSTESSEEVMSPSGTSPFISASRVLVIGAGGIGCEVLKCLVLSGFRDIFVIDLDTIDGTNLNRQFLFRQKDVGQPKSTTAVAEVSSWRCSASSSSGVSSQEMKGVLANVKDASFDVDFYKQFDVVINGLDNMSARKHVNRVVLSGALLTTTDHDAQENDKQSDEKNGTPFLSSHMPSIIESGTMGYNGQVQPIVPLHSECYDCRPKPSDVKTFAVCTIHARPTTMVHCVHFAKELYNTLFAESSSAATQGNEMGYAAPFAWSSMQKPQPQPQALKRAAAAFVDLLFIERVNRQREQLQLATPNVAVQTPRPLPVSGSIESPPSEVASDLTALMTYISHAIDALTLLWTRPEPRPSPKKTI